MVRYLPSKQDIRVRFPVGAYRVKASNPLHSNMNDEVKTYFLNKGFNPDIIDQAMKHVNYEFGTKQHFRDVVSKDMMKFMNMTVWMSTEMRQIGNGF